MKFTTNLLPRLISDTLKLTKDCFLKREVRIDWEGRNIGVFANVSDVNTEKGTIRVWVWDIGREAILFELPGEDVNLTGRRLWASREWLDRSRVA